MSSHFPWDVLGLDGPSDGRSIRRRYAALAKVHRPDTDPEGFQRLRAAYEAALERVVEAPGEGALAAPVAEPAVATVEVTTAEVVEADAADRAQQREWRAQLHALIRASGMEVDSEPGVPVLTVDPAPASLERAVRALLAHPANENLNTARETEYALVTLAARSPVWPTGLVELVWRHYELEQRLAFTEGWHPVHHIQRRLDDAQQWDAVRQQAQKAPQSPQGMLFQPPGWRGRLRWWFAESVREQSMALVDAVRERHPARMDELNAASVALLEKTVARVAWLPRLGPIGLMLLIAQAMFWQFQVASWWSSRGDAFPNHVWFWCVLGYLGCVAAKRWWLPRVAGLVERFPLASDAAEPLAMIGVIAAHAVGGVAPGAWSAVGMLCGAVLLGLRALSGRHATLFRLPIGPGLGGVLVLLALGLLPFGVTSVAPLMPMWPLLALVVLTHHLPYPPLVLDEGGRRFFWRSLPERGFAARPVLVGLCLVVTLWALVVARQGGAYEAIAWSGPGVVVVYLPWLLLGWMTLGGTLGQTLGTLGSVAVAFWMAALLSPAGGVGTFHLMVALLGAFHALLWLWRLREGRASPATSGVPGRAESGTGASWLPALGNARINPWLAFFLLFLVVKVVAFALKD
jgi:hypothetical protein